MALHPITSFCNQKCVFCSAYGRNDDLFDLKRVIKEISNDNDSLIVISGGEPFSVGIDNLVYIVNFINKRHKQIELQTNATFLNKIDEDKLKMFIKLLNKNNGYLNINLSAHNSTMDFKISGSKNFDEKISNIKKLSNLGAIIRITHVINSVNYKYIVKFANFVIKDLSFVNWIQFSYVKGVGRAENNKKIIPKYRDVSPYLIKAFDLLEKNKIRFDVDHIPLCFLEKYYNKHIDIYKIKNGICGDYLKEKAKLESCNGCKFYNICSGPRKDYISIYKKL